MKVTARIELVLMSGEIYGTAIGCLAELLASPEWSIDRDGDEITLDGDGISIAIHDASPSPLGPVVLVTGHFGLDLASVEQALRAVGEKLEAADLLYVFRFGSADGARCTCTSTPAFQRVCAGP